MNYDCIFLDRDGTINPDETGYIKSLDDYLSTQGKTYESYVSDMKKALTLTGFKRNYVMSYIKNLPIEYQKKIVRVCTEGSTF